MLAHPAIEIPVEMPALDTSLKPFMAISAIRKLQRDPEDTKQIFTILRAMRGRSGLRMYAHFAQSQVGRAVLAERRILLSTLTDQTLLEAQPQGSVGWCYRNF